MATTPQRPAAHRLETASERYFERCLPPHWTAERVRHDYGIDLRLALFDGDHATNLELLVQLKAAAEPSDGDTERVVLRTATYHHLWSQLQVAMLVKFVAAEEEAYWLLFRDIATPPADQDTFTIHIPRENRLSRINWGVIAAYVREVTETKRGAWPRR